MKFLENRKIEFEKERKNMEERKLKLVQKQNKRTDEKQRLQKTKNSAWRKSESGTRQKRLQTESEETACGERKDGGARKNKMEEGKNVLENKSLQQELQTLE